MGVQVRQVGQVAVIGLGCKQRQHFTEDIGLEAAHTQAVGSQVELAAMQEQGALNVPESRAVKSLRPGGMRRALCGSEGCSTSLKQGQQAQSVKRDGLWGLWAQGCERYVSVQKHRGLMCLQQRWW